MQRQIVWEGDTPYGHYQVVDCLYDGRPARVLYSGDRQAAQSGVAHDGLPDLLFDYNQRMFELTTNLGPQRILLVGGAVLTLPGALLQALPHVRIDVVEPDRGLTQLAHEYFEVPVDERISVFHTDGRSFLREHTGQYDLMLVDAFMHTAIPKDLRTVEFFRALYEHLAPNGVVAMNIISGYHGRNKQVLHEVYAAVRQSFGVVDIFLASRGYSLWLPQNFVLVAQKDTDLQLKDYVRYGTVEPPDVGPEVAPRDGE